MTFESDLFCPACGAVLLVPEGKTSFFCSECGRPVDLELARAVRTAREGAQAALAAQAAAQESLRVAQEQARAQAEQAAAARRQAEEQEARWEAERRAREREAAEARAQAEARVAAEARAQAEVRVAAEARAAAQRQAQDAPRDTGVEADGTIRDRTTGCGLFWVRMPAGWAVTDTALVSQGSASRPYRASVRMQVPGGGRATMGIGDAGTRNSAGMKMLMLQYGAALAGVDTTNYADMPDPLAVADAQAAQVARSLGGTGLSLLGQLTPPDIETRRREASDMYQRMVQMTGGGLGAVHDAWAGIAIRVFGVTCAGMPWRIASYVRVYAAKLGVVASSPFGGGGLGEALGSLFGGGGRRQAAPAQPPSAQAAPATPAMWCTSDYASYVRGGTIYWSVECEATLAAPADAFDGQLRGAFLPLVESYLPHEDLDRRSTDYIMAEAAALQGATNVAIQGMNMRTQAALEANRQVQAAFDAKNASWQAASDAHHRQFRQATNAQFSGPSSRGGAGDFSEAIRGVNTYTTSDGREVEVDVRAEHVFENPGGDVWATDSHFEPGGDWTEIPRT